MKKFTKNLALIASCLLVVVAVNGCGGGSCSSDTDAQERGRYSVGGGIYDAYSYNPRVISVAPKDDSYVNCNRNAQEDAFVTLVLNNSEEKKIVLEGAEQDSDGLIKIYKFDTKLEDGDDYNVTIKACGGAGLSVCDVAKNIKGETNTSGTINGKNVENANIVCSYEI
jgi:hypothetical protein